MLPRIWTQETIAYQGTYFQIPPREVLPKPVQRPHPPLWSACGSDETARLIGGLGMGGLFGSEGGPARVQQLMTLYRDALWTAPGYGSGPAPRAARSAPCQRAASRGANAPARARARQVILRRHASRVHSFHRTVRSSWYRGSIPAVRHRTGAAQRGPTYPSPVRRPGDPALPGKRATRRSRTNIARIAAVALSGFDTPRSWPRRQGHDRRQTGVVTWPSSAGSIRTA